MAGGLDKNSESFGVRVKGFWDLHKTKWVSGMGRRGSDLRASHWRSWKSLLQPWPMELMD